MFDNFGIGEFLMLAFFALLFFGPERLPQMGAKLGRWLAKLTQQSKLFMTQWREEALAIQEAVQEVKGIRDEIMAARNEIAETMNTAQQDVTESLEDARGALGEATSDVSQAITRAGPSSALAASGDGSGEAKDRQTAIEQTQQILADLDRKRAGSQDVVDEGQDLEEIAQKVEGDDQAVKTGVAEGQIGAEEPEAAEGAGAFEGAHGTEGIQAAEEAQATKPIETALKDVQPEAQEAAEEVEPEDEWTKNYRLIQEGLKSRPSSAQAESDMRVEGAKETEPGEPAELAEPAQGGRGGPPLPAPAQSAESAGAAEPVESGGHGGPPLPAPGTLDEFTQLNKEVARLQTEMHLLRKEVQALRNRVMYQSLHEKTPAVSQTAVLSEEN
jgi:Sec-independent protein translocase protein TatA